MKHEYIFETQKSYCQDTLSFFTESVFSSLTKISKSFQQYISDPKRLFSFIFVSEARIQEINKQTRGKDSVTDIITLPYEEIISYPKNKENKETFAECYLCLPQIEKQAEEQGIPLDEEIKNLLIHGILHAFAFDHISDEDYEIMNEYENRLKKQIKRKKEKKSLKTILCTLFLLASFSGTSLASSCETPSQAPYINKELILFLQDQEKIFEKAKSQAENNCSLYKGFLLKTPLQPISHLTNTLSAWYKNACINADIKKIRTQLDSFLRQMKQSSCISQEMQSVYDTSYKALLLVTKGKSTASLGKELILPAHNDTSLCPLESKQSLKQSLCELKNAFQSFRKTRSTAEEREQKRQQEAKRIEALAQKTAENYIKNNLDFGVFALVPKESREISSKKEHKILQENMEKVSDLKKARENLDTYPSQYIPAILKEYESFVSQEKTLKNISKNIDTLQNKYGISSVENDIYSAHIMILKKLITDMKTPGNQKRNFGQFLQELIKTENSGKNICRVSF